TVAVILIWSGNCLGADAAQRRHIEVAFDYSAAEVLLHALESGSSAEAQMPAVLQNQGVAATIKKMQVLFPPGNVQGYDASETGFKQAFRDAVTNHAGSPGVFKLTQVLAQRVQIDELLQQLHHREAGIKRRMSVVLGRYAPVGTPPRVTVNFVVGGSSDGFVIDDDPVFELFVAINKAEGDEVGLEYNIDHELYHVLQKASGLRSSDYIRFVHSFKDQPPLEKLIATILWEGSATFAVDARDFSGSGPYISMWRGRYAANETVQRRRANFALFDELATELAAGEINWQEAYTRGFSNEQLYHVGREMTRALVAAHSARYLDELFTRPPAEFFRDYIALCARDGDLIPFSTKTRGAIESLPAGW
ncbi:MAG TPA: DUF5700 domain-containing putative Zn-dependent protease, partial [Steroidobacteraceae bacterium]|nr:DUF5700 domain-containing putative Zn-dependent protease [Steroidobacteraceae bacterium]